MCGMNGTGGTVGSQGELAETVLGAAAANEEADALTNGCFEGFDAALRVDISISDIRWKVMDVMMAAGGGMVGELERLRAPKRELKARMKEEKKKRRRRLDDGSLRERDHWR